MQLACAFEIFFQPIFIFSIVENHQNIHFQGGRLPGINSPKITLTINPLIPNASTPPVSINMNGI
jgi:hypothetical protein